MKYFASFLDNGLNECHWSCDDSKEFSHPEYIAKDKIIELSKEEYDNIHNVSLKDGKPVLDSALLEERQLQKKMRKEFADRQKNSLLDQMLSEKRSDKEIEILNKLKGE